MFFFKFLIKDLKLNILGKKVIVKFDKKINFKE
jgi:hypothetical protein